MIRLAIGVPGAGKSICLQDCARIAVLEHEWPVFAVDRAGEWLPDETERWRNSVPPLKVFYSEDDWIKFRRRFPDSIPPRVYVFQGFEAQRVATLGMNVGNVIFCDDEIDSTAPITGVWHPSRKEPEGNPLREYCHRGRHKVNSNGFVSELHWGGAARRIQNVQTDITQLADEVFIFRVAGSKTVKRLVDDFDLNAEQAQAVLKLPNFHYLKWTSKGDGKGNHIFPGYIDPIGNVRKLEAQLEEE